MLKPGACWPACSQPVHCPRLGGSKAWSAYLPQRPAAEVLQRSRGVAASQRPPLSSLPPLLEDAAQVAPLETRSHLTSKVPAGDTNDCLMLKRDMDEARAWQPCRHTLQKGWQQVEWGADQSCSMLGLQAVSCSCAPEEAGQAWPLLPWWPLCRLGMVLASALRPAPSTLHIGCVVNLLTRAACVTVGVLVVSHRRL